MTSSNKKGLGIKGRLMLSFGLVALTTVLAGGVGILSYDSIESASLKVSEESVPAMANAFHMVEQATALRSSASTMAGASNQAQHAAATAEVQSYNEDMQQILDGMAESAIPEAKIVAIQTLKRDLFSALQSLSDRVLERLQAAEQRDVTIATITKDHSNLTNWLVPQIDDAGFELVIETESTTENLGNQIESLMTDGVNRLQSALALKAEVNLLASILIEAAVAQDQGTLAAAADRFEAAKASVDEQLAMLNEDGTITTLDEPVLALTALGNGPDGIFASRKSSFKRGDDDKHIDPLDWARRVYGPREAILHLLAPIVDEASFDLIILSESAVADNAKTINQLIDHSVGNLQGLLGIAADANWLAGLLHQASMEQDDAALGPLVEQINAATEHLEVYRGMLRLTDEAQQELNGRLEPLLARTAGSEAVVEMRTAEIDIWRGQQADVELTADIADRLTQAVNEVVGLAYTDVHNSSDAVQAAITNGRWLLAILSLCSLAIAVAVVTLYVGPNIVKPLREISRSVGRLARGENVVLSGSDRNDELGALAR
ncbi:MAG: MCP four helix bundle domain-containing protein [Pseudomonadota bacterium]